MSHFQSPSTRITPAAPPGSRLKVMSFGFKYGLPQANYYFDVSFATNPARQAQWGMAASVDEAMVRFVLTQPAVHRFIERVVPLLEHLITVDGYQVVAFGCNSGRHRSPVIAEEVAARLAGLIDIVIEHRDQPGAAATAAARAAEYRPIPLKRAVP